MEYKDKSLTLEFMSQLGKLTTDQKVLKRKTESEFRSLRAKNASLVTKLTDANKKITELTTESLRVKSLLSDKRLQEVKNDTTTIHALYRTAYLKMTVSTEIAMLTKDSKILYSVIRAFDMDDDWWNKRRSISLKQWKAELGKLAVHLTKHNDNIRSFEPTPLQVKPKTVTNYVDEIIEERISV